MLIKSPKCSNGVSLYGYLLEIEVFAFLASRDDISLLDLDIRAETISTNEVGGPFQ
jgi:hypothetical protein